MTDVPNHFNRRDFIMLSSGAAATLFVAGLGGCASSSATSQASLGVQLYSVRHELDDDLEGTLEQLSAMGFEGVEFASYYDRSAEELRSILDAHDLQCCGSHIYFSDLQGGSFQETVEFNETLENEYLIIRWIDEFNRESRETFMETIEEYNAVSQRLEKHNMRLGYHSHDYIFGSFNGDLLWDILGNNTDERFVMQLDTAYAASTGNDPVELIERHPGRITSIHAKAYSATNEEAVIGEDDLDWPRIIAASEDVGNIEWHILEYEIEGVPPLEALDASLKNYKEMRE